MSQIERGTGVAVWRQIARDLQSDIARGQINPGDRLPTELELADRYRVNRHTVRRAIAELANDGYVTAMRGRGTFVADKPIAYPLTARTRFSEIVSAQELTPGGRVIAARTEPASDLIAERLNLSQGEQVLRVETLRVVEARPVALGTGWLATNKVPNFLLDYAELGSISGALARAGFGNYRRQSSWITAIAADHYDATHLRMDEGTPLLQVESLDVTEDGAPLQFSKARFAPGFAQLVVTN